jgi:hypothetical protein
LIGRGKEGRKEAYQGRKTERRAKEGR